MKSNITRILLSMVLFMCIGTTKAFADYLYVITDGNGNYLANNSGSIANASSFNPATCVWTCSGDGSGTLSNNGYYLRYSSSKLSLSQSYSTNWTISNNNVSYTYFRTTYYINYTTTSSSWSVSSAQSSGASIYATTLTTTDAVSSFVVGYQDQGIDTRFERPDDSRDYYTTLYYTPAYNTYTWTTSDGTAVTHYASTDNSYVSDTAPEAITTATSYSWTSDHSGNLTFDDETIENPTVTYETRLDADADVTITATAIIEKSASSFLTADVTLTDTDKVSLKSRYETNIQYKVDSHTLYVGETENITYAGFYDEQSTITFTSSDTSIAEVSSDGVITAKGVGTSGTDNATVVITASTSQTDEYEASSSVISITVRKHPTTLTLEYDKSALTYGEATPALTTMTLTDTHDNTTITDGNVIYSSSNKCVDVNTTTGALTVNYAGTAVITAEYSGDDTHVKASATYTVTVSKAATTLTFEQDSYIAQLTKPFESPKASLTPEGAGTVTYSYTSATENLITLDATTGAITFGDVTGTATVTATFAGDDKYEAATASYVLTVTNKEIPDFTFEIGKKELYVEEYVDATASTTCPAGITFASSNASVFTVTSEGRITAIGEGVAFLRITSLEDDTYLPISADIPITVKRWPTKIVLEYSDTHYYTDHEGNIMPKNVTLHESVNNYLLAGLSDYVEYSTDDNDAFTVNAKTGQITLLGDADWAMVTATFVGTEKYAPSSTQVLIEVRKVITPGTFIRLKDIAGNYLSSDGTTVSASSSTADASSIIWYGEDRSLLFYECGLYMKDATPALANAVNIGESGTKFTFTHNLDNYTISDGTNVLTSNSSTDWTMEEVEILPLTFNSKGYGYATFYCPVELSCPAGVVAYYPTVRSDGTSDGEYVITLKSVTGGYIPRTTPVILHTNYADVTYNFHIVNETMQGFSDQWEGLQGTIATINTSSAYSGAQWPYALQPLKSSEEIGFYPWESKKHATITAFRCFIPGSTAAGAKGFRFVVDDTADGITDIDAPAESGMYYNLQGIPVGTDFRSLPAGVYIKNGVKRLKD